MDSTKYSVISCTELIIVPEIPPDRAGSIAATHSTWSRTNQNNTKNTNIIRSHHHRKIRAVFSRNFLPFFPNLVPVVSTQALA